MARSYKVRGLEKRHEIDPAKTIRDTRSFFEKWGDLLTKEHGLPYLFAVSAVIAFVYPALTEVILITCLVHLFILWEPYLHAAVLPLKLPVVANAIDYNSPMPGHVGFKQSEGKMFIGNAFTKSQELWSDINDFLTHEAVWGTTGGGKTEFLLSKLWNLISMNSGAIYLDPKGTTKLAAQIWVLCRIMGREDDFLLLNFSRGGKTVAANSSRRLSNTANPFQFGNADTLADIFVSLLPEDAGQNQTFLDRAIAFINSLLLPLVDMRDSGHIQLSVAQIRRYMNFRAMCNLAESRDIDGRQVRLTKKSIDSITAFLDAVGYEPGISHEKQPEEAKKQFSYALSYFTRALSSFSDVYGHIYGSMLGEIDMRDIVLRRRILVGLLPSLEKSPAELQQLGKVNLTAIRSAISVGLGDKAEGTFVEMFDSLPMSANTPYGVIIDEYGYVASSGVGFAIVLAQSRGLGVGVCLAAQDYASMKRASEIEAEQILANTKLKYFMALEDVKSTWELAQAISGQGFTIASRQTEFKPGEIGVGEYRPSLNVELTERARVTLNDLREQVEGEFHLFYKGDVIRGRAFYVNPPLPPTGEMKINRFAEVLYSRQWEDELIKKYAFSLPSLNVAREIVEKGWPKEKETSAQIAGSYRILDRAAHMLCSTLFDTSDAGKKRELLENFLIEYTREQCPTGQKVEVQTAVREEPPLKAPEPTSMAAVTTMLFSDHRTIPDEWNDDAIDDSDEPTVVITSVNEILGEETLNDINAMHELFGRAETGLAAELNGQPIVYLRPPTPLAENSPANEEAFVAMIADLLQASGMQLPGVEKKPAIDAAPVAAKPQEQPPAYNDIPEAYSNYEEFEGYYEDEGIY